MIIIGIGVLGVMLGVAVNKKMKGLYMEGAGTPLIMLCLLLVGAAILLFAVGGSEADVFNQLGSWFIQ